MTELPANHHFPDVEIEPSSSTDVQPRPGTLAWVAAQDVVEHLGAQVPACHRIPEDASLAELEPANTLCRVVSADGQRCRGTRLLAYGLCMGHAGGGGMSDHAAMSRRGAAKQQELRLTRELLGIGPRTAGNPRAAARLLAAQRASEIASAIVDGPLDADLGPIERQKAALAVLDATFPLQAASLTLSSTDPEDMDWKSMQEMAISLLS